MIRSKAGRFLAFVALGLFILAAFVPLPHGPPLLVQFVTQTWRDLGETWGGRKQYREDRAAAEVDRRTFYRGFDARFAGAVGYTPVISQEERAGAEIEYAGHR